MTPMSTGRRLLPPSVHLLDFEYEYIRGDEGAQDEDQPAEGATRPFQVLHRDPLHRVIFEEVLGIHEDSYLYTMKTTRSSSGSTNTMRTTIHVSIYPTSHQEHETILASKQDLRASTSRQLVQAWENLPEEDRGRYQIITQSGSQPCCLAFDLHIVPGVPIPPPDVDSMPPQPNGSLIRPHDQAKKQAQGLIQDAMMTSGVRLGATSAETDILPGGDDRIHIRFQGRDGDENVQLVPRVREMVETLASQHDWFHITFVEDSE